MAVEPTGVETRMEVGVGPGPSGVRFLLSRLLSKSRPWLYPAAMAFCLPQVFLAGYFLPDLLTRHDPVTFWKAAFAYGLTLVWVSLPYFSLAAYALARAVRGGVRARYVFSAAFAAWAAWVVLWNLLVYPSFGFARSIFPVVLCTVLSVAFPLVRRFYLESVRELEGAGRKKGGENVV